MKTVINRILQPNRESDRVFTMATKMKAMIPPVPMISQRSTFSKDDGKQLIREQSIRKSASRRPKFSVRPKKFKTSLKSKKAKADQVQQQERPPTEHPVLWDAFVQSDPVSETGKNTKRKIKKRKISFKVDIAV